MTYRGSLPPPGQGYNGQQQQHQQQQQQQQQQMAPDGYNAYANGIPYPNPQYRNVQYQNTVLGPQHQLPQHLPAQGYANPPQQYGGYGGAYSQQVAANQMQYNIQQQLPPQHVATPPNAFQPLPRPLPVEQPQHAVFQPMPSPVQPSPTQLQASSRGSAETIAPNKILKKSQKTQTPGHSPVARPSSIPAIQKYVADTSSLLVCVAEDCFEKAHTAVQDVAARLEGPMVEEYHKLIATGLGCLEVAMQSNKLSPRVEAKVRLRYATILSDETENLMEAETALTKGITICEMHRFADLKYCMQYLLLKVLFRRNPKAALVATDKYISDSLSARQVHWVYAFRFLRAAFNLRPGHTVDSHAIENLRHIAGLADQRGDNAVSVLTSLLEGLAHLRTKADDTVRRVQDCIAHASKHQQDPSVHIPQLDVLVLLLDLACSLQEKSPGRILDKIKALQVKMDDLIQNKEWDQVLKDLRLPLQKQPNTAACISQDTRSVVAPGTGTHDYLVLSWVSKHQAFALVHVFSGLASEYKNSSGDKSLGYWNEALKLLAKLFKQKPQREISLQEAIEQVDWRAKVGRYLYILMGLHSASQADWPRVKECVSNLGTSWMSQQPKTPLDAIALYLVGVLYQGTGNLAAATRVFEDPVFAIGDGDQVPSEVSLLAALNRLWIMQEPGRFDGRKITELVEHVRRFCDKHPDNDLRTAYNLTMATIHLNPPLSMNQVKQHIHASLNGSQATNNTHYLSIALNIMRCKLFDKVVGEQALKSAKAGAAQAKKSGNMLWMSVADGMLAESYEMQRDMAQATAARQSGTRLANDALAKTKVEI